MCTGLTTMALTMTTTKYFNHVAGNDNSEDNNAPKADLACCGVIPSRLHRGSVHERRLRVLRAADLRFSMPKMYLEIVYPSSRHAWAGPSHWKFPGQAHPFSQRNSGDTGVAKQLKRPRTFIDFFAPARSRGGFRAKGFGYYPGLKNTKATRGAEEAKRLAS